ncbi:Hypothetical predicted protein [Olea europaea subsp. europaea]|uniref:Uncharacterized protein n=1 Tax=Olea europaea subsp. europaea TaxID=158383 RepID=A0A8S0RTU7_OLEEU|nr:Hypothetical predicted protein [Olea europaea subsp. europaea]
MKPFRFFLLKKNLNRIQSKDETTCTLNNTKRRYLKQQFGMLVICTEYKQYGLCLYDEMLVKEYPFGGIPIDNPKVGLNIIMSVLSAKPGYQIRGLKDGRLQDIKTSSSNVHNMEELEAECVARKVEYAARVKMEQRTN